MIIWLNGPTSSGKTSLSIALQNELPEVFLHGELDKFIAMLPENVQSNRELMLKELGGIVSTYHKAMLMLVKDGRNVIVDHVFENSEWFRDCSNLFSNEPVYMVGINASPKILKTREVERGNRQVGLYLEHLNEVHNHTGYDLMLNSDTKSPQELAKLVLEHISKFNPKKGLIR